jgi:actin-related protein
MRAVNFDIEQQVWAHLLGTKCLSADCSTSTLLLTEPYFNMRAIKDDTLEILFDAFDFAAVACVPGKCAANTLPHTLQRRHLLLTTTPDDDRRRADVV